MYIENIYYWVQYSQIKTKNEIQKVLQKFLQQNTYYLYY